MYQVGLVVRQADGVPVSSWSCRRFVELLVPLPASYPFAALWEFRRAFGWTLAIGVSAATLSVALAAPLAWWGRRGGLRAVPAVIVAAAGAGTMGPLVGIALIRVFTWSDRSLVVWLYDRTVLAPVLAATWRCLPMAVLICWLAFRGLPRVLLDAARVDGAGPIARFVRVGVAQRTSALAVAWLVSFSISSGELSATILVVPPGVTTVPIRVFGLLHSGVTNQAAAICLTGILVLLRRGGRHSEAQPVRVSTSGRRPVNRCRLAACRPHAIIGESGGWRKPEKGAWFVRSCLQTLAALFAMLCVGGVWNARPVGALEHVSVRRDGREVELAGRVLVEAQDGGLLLETATGVLQIIQPEELVRRETDATVFQPLGPEEVARQLLAELPPGFQIHRTANYVICYNTSDAYAEWCGSLYERLYRGYYSYWKNRGLELRKPEFPLVALVFENKASYASYAEKELGGATYSIIGYYNMQTNRVTMYDLTGVDGLRKSQRGVSSAAHINQVLSQPAAERTVATIVHEATHQLAYNTGLQTTIRRQSDVGQRGDRGVFRDARLGQFSRLAIHWRH